MLIKKQPSLAIIFRQEIGFTNAGGNTGEYSWKVKKPGSDSPV